jgi:hypothetical protein
MITLSNGRKLEYLTASGAMGFDGKGWFWEKPLIAAGLIDLSLFTVVLRSITLEPRLWPVCNHSWLRPWTWLPFCSQSCVRTIKDGIINKVGLYNPGLQYWCDWIGPNLQYSEVPLIASIFGTLDECVKMTQAVNSYDVIAIEVNASCPNSGHAMDKTAAVINCVSAVKASTSLPVIVKVSVDQDYMEIAKNLRGVAEAVSFNSVPYKVAFPDGPLSPLEKIGKPGTGGGGVSAKAAQAANWKAQGELAEAGYLPVIGSSPAEYGDLHKLWQVINVDAIAFGGIHLPSHPFLLKPWSLFTNPCRPTRYVEMYEAKREAMAAELVAFLKEGSDECVEDQ